MGLLGRGGWTVWSETPAIIMKLGKYTWEHMSVNIQTECCDIPRWRPPRPPLMYMGMVQTHQNNTYKD